MNQKTKGQVDEEFIFYLIYLKPRQLVTSLTCSLNKPRHLVNSSPQKTLSTRSLVNLSTNKINLVPSQPTHLPTPDPHIRPSWYQSVGRTNHPRCWAYKAFRYNA